MTRLSPFVAPLVVAYRSGFEESVHHGVAVALDEGGDVTAHVGDPTAMVYPRSSLKPLQASAMVGLGLELSDPLLALVCASHNGDVAHRNGVREILELYGLDERALRNTASLPFGSKARRAARADGDPPSSLAQNCSGKHAGMLATCVVNGWPIEDYLEPEHPLQVGITTHVASLAGDVAHLGVDGCGAPAHATSVVGLARAYRSLVLSESPIARAMTGHPVLVAGDDRDVTIWMRAVAGLVAKDGAGGVMAMALGDGRAAAFKVADGFDPARQAAVGAGLRSIGVDTATVSDDVRSAVAVPVLGHGHPVGWYEAVEWTAGPLDRAAGGSGA